MRYLVLGPFEVWDGDRPVHLARKWRVLLAVLLMNANRVVPAERLISELYGGRPPSSSAKLIQLYVGKLRRALGDPGGDVLLTRPNGYQLMVDTGQLDARQFERLAAEGRQALRDGSHASAADRLGDALALWRGGVLADVTHSPGIEAEAMRLEELLLAAWEGWAEARLGLGHHAEVIGELRSAVFEHPLRERLRGQLMIALAGAGRRADALAEYTAGRNRLVEELGVEPGAELRAVHAAILAGDPLPVGGPAAPRGPEPGHQDPVCQLPAAVGDLVGRDVETQRVRDLLLAGGSGGPPRRVVVTGQPGVGKSALAVHVAHALRSSFPDGQLYVDLDTADARPAGPGDVLAGLLCAYGYAKDSIPEGLNHRAALWRGVLADSRALLVLDNAVEERQIRPLLPGTPGSAVLITSRVRLVGLEDAIDVELDALSHESAHALLSRVVGAERIDAEKAAAARVVTLCGGLPLAIRIAGARLVAQPDRAIDEFAGDLQRHRLDELAAGDLAVRAAIARSETALDKESRLMWQRLAMVDAETLPEWASAALLDTAGDARRPTVQRLLDHHLLQRVQVEVHEPARYRLPDLVALYGREFSATDDTAADRKAALWRLCANYLSMARLAEQRLSNNVLTSPASVSPPPHLPERTVDLLLTDAFGWLESERGTIVGLIEQAAIAGLHHEAAGLAVALSSYFEASGHVEDWRRSHETALASARATGDRRTMATVLRNIGELHIIQDRYDEAIDSLNASLKEFGAVDDVVGKAAVESGLGMVYRLRGRYDHALRHLTNGARLTGSMGNSAGQAYARAQIGSVYLERGDSRAARRHFRNALAVADQGKYRPGVATALRCLGLVELATGRHTQASARFAASVAVCAELGDRTSQIHGELWLGHLSMLRGDHSRPADTLQQCLLSYQQYGQLFGQAMALRSLSQLHLRAGHTGRALQDIQASLDLWSRIHSPYWTARTLDILAQVHQRRAEGADSRLAASHAARLRTRIGLPAAVDRTGRARSSQVYAFG